MSDIDIADYNRRWLQAWTDKDVEALLAFYTPDTVFRSASYPPGFEGIDALRGYLTRMFAATPPTTYAEDEIWPLPQGYCARWYARMERPEGDTVLRGFDIVRLEGDKIAFNEVYTHTMPADPA